MFNFLAISIGEPVDFREISRCKRRQHSIFSLNVIGNDKLGIIFKVQKMKRLIKKQGVNLCLYSPN